MGISKNKIMKFWLFIAIFAAMALAQYDSWEEAERAKGAESCGGTKIPNKVSFKCKHKKKKGKNKMKRCRLSGCDVKKIFCHESGWANKKGNKSIDVSTVCA